MYKQTGEGFFYGWEIYPNIRTERAMFDDQLWKLEKLLMGYTPEHVENIPRMRVDLELLWLDALRAALVEKCGEEAVYNLDIQTMFQDAFNCGVSSGEYWFKENLYTFPISWEEIVELVKTQGLDYRIEAYAEGVPLAYILGE